jgi:hypothetical protein
MEGKKSFWEYRQEQESLGKANGMQPFPTKALMATVSADHLHRLICFHPTN